MCVWHGCDYIYIYTHTCVYMCIYMLRCICICCIIIYLCAGMYGWYIYVCVMCVYVYIHVCVYDTGIYVGVGERHVHECIYVWVHDVFVCVWYVHVHVMCVCVYTECKTVFFYHSLFSVVHYIPTTISSHFSSPSPFPFLPSLQIHSSISLQKRACLLENQLYMEYLHNILH